MQRRSFLAGILAGAAAPAIVRASSLMKIWVPSQDLIRGDCRIVAAGDLTWDDSERQVDGWVHYATTRKDGKLTHYTDGEVTDSRIIGVDHGLPGGDFTAECWSILGPGGIVRVVDWKLILK